VFEGVVLIGFKLDVLLLLKKLLFVIYDFHLTFKHFVETIVLLLILNPLDEFHQDVLAPFRLDFIVCNFLYRQNDGIYELDSLLLSLAVPLLFGVVLTSDRVLKDKVAKLALNDSIEIWALTEFCDNLILDSDRSSVNAHFNEL
jgi:hypothetical protein